LTEKFVVGIVGSPFGVKGFVKVRPLSGEIEHLLKLQSVTVTKDGKEKLLQIEEINPSPPNVLIHFKGIDTPEAAKTLNGAQLLVDRSQAAPLAEGEFYIEDLKGLQIISGSGEQIGIITDIIEGGGGELVEIKLTDSETRLVPLRKEFFPDISPENCKIVLENLWILE